MGYYDRWREMIPPGHWSLTDPALTAFYQALADQDDGLIAAIHAARTWLSPVNADAEGISRWEKLLGISSEGALETRRARVMARLAGYGTIRKEVLAAIAQAFGAAVVIEELPAQYKFRVLFSSPLGEPPYVEELRAVYDTVKRATWQYELVYNLNAWINWSAANWRDITTAGLTWSQLQSTDPHSVVSVVPASLTLTFTER